jgi:uncharacterized protein
MNPWYREPWPWILMSGPAAAIVAGAATIWIAVASADGLVAEDYYKQGLAINKLLAREEAARELGLSAEIRLEPGRIAVHLQGQSPEALFAHLAHGTRAGHDLRVRLARTAAGAYEAELPPLAAGRWHIVIEDARGTWRIARDGR